MRRGKAEAGGFRFNICVMVRDRLLFFPVKTNNFHSPDVWPTDREKGGAPFQIVNYTRSENQFKSWLLIGTLERDQGRHYSSPLPTSLIPTVFVRQTNLVRAISYYYLGSLLFGAKYFQTNVREKGCVHYLRRHLFFESRKISSSNFPLRQPLSSSRQIRSLIIYLNLDPTISRGLFLKLGEETSQRSSLFGS